MKRLMLLLALLAIPVSAAQQPTMTVIGDYVCRGVQKDPYTLYLIVQPQRSELNFLFLWSEHRGQAPIMTGVGFQDAGRLMVAFASTRGMIGVASYVVSSGRLIGRWAIGDGNIYDEICARGEPA